MSSIICVRVVAGLAGIAAGTIAIVGIVRGKPFAVANSIFLSATTAACATGFIFLPTDGVTSAQIVAFFITALLSLAAYARYVRHLDGCWNQIYALTAVGTLFLNILITTAQSFLHVAALKELAPTQGSPIYIVVKATLLLLFVLLAVLAAKRAGRS